MTDAAMSGPATTALAAAMLLVAAYCAGRILLARHRGRTTSYTVDAFHVAMGVAMAGMLSPRLFLGDRRLWVSVFAVSAAGFAWRAFRPSGMVSVAHVVTSGAMIVMLTASPAAAGTASMASVSRVGAAPVLGVVLIVFLAAYSGAVIERLPAPAGGVLAPRSLACCQLAMNAAMAYMLFALV